MIDLDQEEIKPYMRKQIVEILGYADDWVLYTIQGITRCCGPKIICKQHSIEWQNGLRQMASESPRMPYTVYMPYTIETGESARLYNTLEWTNIGGSRHTQNTGVYTGHTTNIKITNPMGADQSTLLRVHKMLVLLAVSQPRKHN
jgi:hypothetical protein